MIVIGGGLAGLSAACALAEAGAAVTLIERRSSLGGRASSLRVPGISGWADNGQHVLTRSCTALLDFYARLGLADCVRFDPEITFISGRGRASALSASALPAPLHLALSFARLPFLGTREKLGIARALAAMRTAQAPPAGETLSTWLQRHGQTPQAIERFWRPVVVSALNEEPERADLRHALFLFRETFLSGRHGWELGVPTRPLAEMHDAPCAAYLLSRGARVLRRSAAVEVVVRDRAVAAVRLADGTVVTGSHYISALPHRALRAILPPPLPEALPFSLPVGLEPVPIVSVHLWLDRPVTDLPHATLVGRPIHWVFSKGQDCGEAGGTHLVLVTSAARELARLPRAAVLDLAVTEIREAFPSARQARVLRALAIKERHATFAPLPGCDRHRPQPDTPLRNLVLAGDWTRTGWPATMEGAVRSGRAAAERLLGG